MCIISNVTRIGLRRTLPRILPQRPTTGALEWRACQNERWPRPGRGARGGARFDTRGKFDDECRGETGARELPRRSAARSRSLGSMGASGIRAAGAPAAPVTVPGFTYVKSLGGIDEYRLDANGLTVLIMPDHSAPVVTFQVTYRVGSRNEVTGTTGATHLLEHMMFKGSERFNDAKGNSIKQYLEHVGGQFNATTSFDRTNYFATLGRDDLDGYVAIEADRMRHLWLRESDRQVGNDRRAQRVRARQERPEHRLDGGGLRGGLCRASVSPPDHRLQERHRARADREAARSSTTRSTGRTMPPSAWWATSSRPRRSRSCRSTTAATPSRRSRSR